jgi:hypothetical protein
LISLVAGEKGLQPDAKSVGKTPFRMHPNKPSHPIERRQKGIRNQIFVSDLLVMKQKNPVILSDTGLSFSQSAPPLGLEPRTP